MANTGVKRGHAHTYTEGTTPADASTTTKGLTKLSTAPATAGDPIAAGTNDPRLSDSRTPLAHDLVGGLHVVTGLAAGQVLKALSASSIGFEAIAQADVVGLIAALAGKVSLTAMENIPGHKTFKGNVFIEPNSATYPRAQLHGSMWSLTAETGWPGLFVSVYSDTAGHAPYHMYQKARGNATSPTDINAAGINIGLFGFRGYHAGDGGAVPPAMANQDGARIMVVSDGPFTNTSQPMSFRFMTAGPGQFIAVEQYRITGDGKHKFGGTTGIDFGAFLMGMRAKVATDGVLLLRGITAQSGNLMEWQGPSNVPGATVYGTISENGFITIRKIVAPADAELTTNELAMWFDSSNILPKFMWKAKRADGTVVSGALPATNGVATQFLNGAGAWATPTAQNIPFTSAVGLPQDDVAEALDGLFTYFSSVDTTLDGRLDAVEADIVELTQETWTGAALPTTGNFEGRRVWATGLTNTNFRSQNCGSGYIYRDAVWRLERPITFNNTSNGLGNVAMLPTVEATILTVDLGTPPCPVKMQATGNIPFYFTPGASAGGQMLLYSRLYIGDPYVHVRDTYETGIGSLVAGVYQTHYFTGVVENRVSTAFTSTCRVQLRALGVVLAGGAAALGYANTANAMPELTVTIE